MIVNAADENCQVLRSRRTNRPVVVFGLKQRGAKAFFDEADFDSPSSAHSPGERFGFVQTDFGETKVAARNIVRFHAVGVNDCDARRFAQAFQFKSESGEIYRHKTARAACADEPELHGFVINRQH